MSRKAERPQKPRHILIFNEDWDFLITNYGPDSTSRIGASPAIRQIIHAYVTALRASQQRDTDRQVQTDPVAVRPQPLSII